MSAVFRIGPFELNEASRSLSMGGRDVAVQPLVFDFLAYLLRHQDRAVGKDELLHQLWPGVTVTEASLQRVASLARGVLRQGGMDEALRSIPRFGYRLCVDQPRPPEESPGQAIHAAAAARARGAYQARDWAAAAAGFAEADAAGGLAADDLVAWAMAVECAGRMGDAIEPLGRAVTAHLAAGDRRRAAGAAVGLARIHLERGEVALVRGWLKRAEDLLADDPSCRESGLRIWMSARIAAAEAEPEKARQLAGEAYEIGRALNDPVLESLGRIYRGFYELCLGDTARAWEDQDAAAALGLSSDVDPIVGSTLYCVILWSCRNVGDWSRASQWSANYDRWCRRAGLPQLTGSCRLHQAEVMGVHGTLAEAAALVEEALAQLRGDAPWAVGDAFRVLGDIHRAAGDLDRAENAYREACAVGWDPQPGFALLQLERGDAEAAYLGLERALSGRGWLALQRQGLLHAALAKAAVRSGRLERASAIISRFESDPNRWPAPAIRAMVAEARAEFALQSGEADAAARDLQAACRLWTDAGAIVSAADSHLALAAVLVEIGDTANAALELGAATTLAVRIKSERLIARCRELEARLPARSLTPGPVGPGAQAAAPARNASTKPGSMRSAARSSPSGPSQIC